MTSSHRPSRRLLPLTAALALIALPSAPVTAQGVTYTSITDSRFGGMLGAMAGLAGAGGESQQTTYLEGSRARTDSDGQSTIVDFEAGQFTWIDHDTRTYSVMTMEEMVQSMRAAGAGAGEPGEEAESDVEWSFEMDVRRTGRTEEILGYDAEQVLVILLTEATGTDAESGQTATMKMAFVNDLWVSDDPAAYRAMQEMGADAAEQIAGGMQDYASGMQAAFAQDPRMKAGLERAREEAEKIDGMTLRSESHIVVLPPGQELDVEAALEGAKGPDAGDAAAGAAAAAARDAVSRRLGGLFGRSRDEPEAAAPTQSTIMTVTTEVTDMTDGVPADAFEVPEGYREVESPFPGG